MAKNSVTEYDTTATNNTDVGGISIEGTANVANFDNALREIMSHIADGTTMKTHVGLANADNTSDANKPVSTAQQTALDAKLSLSGGTMTGNIIATGINLGGTGAANLITDFEEGTYAATITCSTSGTVTLNSSFDTLQYVKVGKSVHASGLLLISSVSSPVGHFTINLPFAATSLTDRAGDSAVTAAIQGVASGVNSADFVGLIVSGTSYASIYLGDSNSFVSDSADALQASAQIYFSATYRTI